MTRGSRSCQAGTHQAVPADAALDVPRLLAAVVNEHHARIVASLIRACGGDFQLAEDALQEALLVALERWPRDGAPSRPDAWLITTAKRRAIDQLRRDQTLARKREQLVYLLAKEQAAQAAPRQEATDAVEDDRLRLIFTCCHPALALESQVALTLRTLVGLDTAAIARAFLVSEETMAKRLTRARAKIRDARIPYQVPARAQLPERLQGVLAVVYLLFNEGYLSRAAATLVRSDLCDEAIRLAHLLHALLPDEPEVTGLLALLLLNDARRTARSGATGELITLEEQDRSLWLGAEIEEGTALLDHALRRRQHGPFQIQAAIAALHMEAARAEDTDWPQIVLLYGRLLRLQPNPVIELNRAVAVAMAFGAEEGLRLLDALEVRAELTGYHLLPAARADLLRRQGRAAEAASAYRAALTLCTNPVEQRYLRRRLAEVRG